MQVNANTIKLQVQNGFHEEYTLDPEETGMVLPGTMVSVKSTVDGDGNPIIQADGVTSAVVTSQDEQEDIDLNEVLVVVENAFLGKTMNHKSNPGEVILLVRPIEGDRLLLRCMPGDYEEGDPLYRVQTPNGIYVTKDAGAADGSAIVAWAVEHFVVPDFLTDGDPTGVFLNRTPKFFGDVPDTSTGDGTAPIFRFVDARGDKREVRMNGGVFNLVRARLS